MAYLEYNSYTSISKDYAQFSNFGFHFSYSKIVNFCNIFLQNKFYNKNKSKYFKEPTSKEERYHRNIKYVLNLHEFITIILCSIHIYRKSWK